MTAAPEALRLFFSHVGAGDRAAVRVLEDPAAIRTARRSGGGSVREFLRLPSTGGGFVLAGLEDYRSFALGLEGLTLSRPIWILARRVLAALSRLGLHRCLGLPRLAVEVPSGAGEDGVRYSLQVGVPGGGQKVIVRERDADGAEGIWKFGEAGLPARLIEAERTALAWLGEREACRGLGPALLEHGADAGAAWIKTEVLPGARPANAPGDEAAAFLARLASAQRWRGPLEQAPWTAELRERIARLEGAAPSVAAPCRAALQQVLDAHGEAEFDFAPAHGDFTPWNTKLQDGRLRAFDWEFFSPAAPALFDWHHWIVQTGVLVERLAAGALEERLAQPVPEALRPFAERRDALLRLYLIDVVSREESVMQHGRPSFEQVRWLWEARSELLDRRPA